LFLLLLTSSPAAEAGGGLVRGTVSSQNGIRLEAVVVEIEGVARTQTDPTGHFHFSEIPAGFYKIVISKAGFPTVNRALLVKSDRAQFLEIVLPGVAAYPPDSQVTAIPLIHRGSAVLVQAQLAPHTEVRLLLDTGATFCAISTSVAKRLGLRPKPGQAPLKIMTPSGAFFAPLVILPSLKVGGLEARDVEALIWDPPGIREQEGTLGLSFLNRFQFMVNPQAGELILRK
jgi:clan AA aspartic protease (TIGR02281 family)